MSCNKTYSFYIFLLLGIFGCSNDKNSNTDQISAKTSELSSSKWANQIPYAKPLPFILEPCSESKRYQSKDWEGTNSCSWALEKEIISALPEYVLRKGETLKFQSDMGGWRTIKEPNAMVNHYLPTTHTFILKYLSSENLNVYGIYDPKQDKLERISGQFFLHPNQKFFAVLPKANSGEKAKIGRFQQEKGVFIEEINVKSPIFGVKWNNEEYAISIKKEGKTNFIYRKLP